jgi:hypothetical protein
MAFFSSMVQQSNGSTVMRKGLYVMYYALLGWERGMELEAGFLIIFILCA